MLQKVFKSVILAWLILMACCLWGVIPDTAQDHQIIVPLVMIPFAGGLSGFVIHLLDSSQSKLNLPPFFSKSIKVFVFLFLVGIAFVLGLNGPGVRL
ncbi:hypothetical protein M3O96_12800 [Aquiflexum sp. TKW24L]|uniref:hypothetical protein n=1 Tax=Aquiflexum sp. TKW24L TaxID=2942212 RepID=UPI0020BFD6CE|nr:hypothetical protein [Aquiflexum sp. TKW24L]MCL6259975.1 hypothetical protein [Aquiflexum sp. TKW24L]